MRFLLIVLTSATLAVVGCSGDDSADTSDTVTTSSTSSTTSTSTPDEPSTTTAPPATTTSTTSPASTTSTVPAPTTTAATTTSTTTVCPTVGDTEEQREAFPERMSALVGADVRTGGQDCFERIVIELQASELPSNDAFPGWWVRYADGPVTYGQTDDQFVEVRGDEILLITLNSWLFYPDGIGYDGPTDIVPTNVEHIEQLLLIDNWEGQHTWAVGLDARRGFGVDVLTDPPRLVIDIQA